MITPAILYKHMRNFVKKGTAKPVLPYIYFDGKKAYATNLYSMAIVKNYPVAKAHYEFPDGLPVQEEHKPIDYDRVLVKKEDAAWTYANKSIMDGKKFMTQWENAFDYLKKATRMQNTPAVLLEYKKGELLVHSANENTHSTIAFQKCSDKLVTGEEWQMGVNVEVLLNAIRFLKATEPHTLQVYINKAYNVLTFETEDLLIVMTALMRGNPDFLFVKKQVEGSNSDFSFDE